MTTRIPAAPPAVRWIVRTLEEAGFETWAVGGAVRDVLAGRPSGDWDLATRATPKEVRKTFRRTVPIGVEHGTVGVLARDGTMYEVTTFRRDVETDGRHAVVEFAETIEEDLGRRDFTINAVAWHPTRETWLDPFNGAADLENGVLRTVGDAAERFAEDYLRILRAFRFAGRFDLDVEAATWDALRTGVEKLTTLSAERIRDELLKVLDADRRPSVPVGLYADSGALAVLYPELAATRADDSASWATRLAAVDSLPTGRPLLRLAALLRGIDPKAVAQLLSRLKLSNAQIDETASRANAPELPTGGVDDADARRWLARVGPSRLSAVARLDLARAKALGHDVSSVVDAWRRARGVRASGAALSVAELVIDGRDLIAMGLKPGPDFGRILDDLLEFVLEEPERNDAETLEARVSELVAGDER